MYATREDIRKAAGELITCGFLGNELDAELKEVLRETNPAGIIFFTRNLDSPAHLAELDSPTEVATIVRQAAGGGS